MNFYFNFTFSGGIILLSDSTADVSLTGNETRGSHWGYPSGLQTVPFKMICLPTYTVTRHLSAFARALKSNWSVLDNFKSFMSCQIGCFLGDGDNLESPCAHSLQRVGLGVAWRRESTSDIGLFSLARWRHRTRCVESRTSSFLNDAMKEFSNS